MLATGNKIMMARTYLLFNVLKFLQMNLDEGLNAKNYKAQFSKDQSLKRKKDTQGNEGNLSTVNRV